MESDELSWNVVPNTVLDRMIDFSLIHKLIPRRRLRRRTRAMNNTMKYFYDLKTYSQYVQLKTSFLRNSSDNSTTDDNASFSEDDYSNLYKSDVSVRNYVTRNSIGNVDYSCKIEIDTDQEATTDLANEQPTLQVPKNKSTKIMNLGWQDVVKRTNESAFLDQMGKDKFVHANSTCSQTNVKESSFQAYLKEDASDQQNEIQENDKLIVTREGAVLNTIVMSTTDVLYDDDPMEKVTKEKVNSVGQTDATRSETMKNIKKNLSTLLNNVSTSKNNNTSFTNVGTCSDQSQFIHSEERSNTQETISNENEDDSLFLIQPFHASSANQPKDSGIEEDTEEELPEHENRIREQTKDDAQAQENTVSARSVSDCTKYCSTEASFISSKINPEDTALFPIESVNNKEDQQDKIQRHRLQPKVTCTEIVNKKYKIIPCNKPLQDYASIDSGELSYNNISDDHVVETITGEENVEDSMSPFTKRRLQQLRRLNLTVDSESSLSEEDNKHYDVENMRDKLFKRSRDSSDLSDNETDNINSKCTTPVRLDGSLEEGKNSRKEKTTKDRSTCPVGICNKNERNKKIHECSECSSETNLGVTAMRCQSVLNINETSKKNVEVSATIQASEGRQTRLTRPCNLQELIEEENLVSETAAPSFRLKDINEDDIYILDIPSMVLESQLLGKKIVFKGKKLKLGKQKYKVTYKDRDCVSCMFGTGKSRKPYKIVNVKPITRIVALEKITETCLMKSPSRYMSDTVSCAEDSSEVETNVHSPTRNLGKRKEEPDLSFQ